VLGEGKEVIPVSAIKITKFLGTAPKNASELLPDTAAQIARNCKLYSGDLIPYPQPTIVADTHRTGTVRTLYALRDPDTDALVWLSWNDVVDIVTPATDTLGEQRFYYTGDGIPKVSTYALATQGVAPYPTNYYELGLPLPTVKPTATATAFSTVSTSSFARSAGNNVTLVTSTPHNIKSGVAVTISGFSFRTGTYSRSGTTITVTITAHGLSSGAEVQLGFTSGTATSNVYTITVTGVNTFTCADTASGSTSGDVRWDIGDLNTTAEVTVINSTTIRYFSSGPIVTTTANTDGRIDLGSQIQARSYLYTWYTGWEEESIGSEPSDALFIKEGQIVTVATLPTVPPSGSNFVRGIRLYRTLAGTTDADYFRLKTLWFPNSVSNVERTSNVSTVKFTYPHQLFEDDRFKISGCSVASFDITGGIVTEVVDQYTIKYAQTAGNVASTAATGDLYYDVSEDPPTSTARYWGDGGDFTFTDDFNFRSLTEILDSNTYDAPPGDLEGLTLIQNSILAGFVGNTLYLSEPGVFHAWPDSYIRTFDSNIVGLAQIGGNLLVLTENYPYVLSGSNPAVMSQARLSARYPCLNRRSIVETSFGVVYATHDGLVLYSPATSAQLFTRYVHSSDTWNAALDPSTLVGTAYKDTYIASHSTASIVYEPGEARGSAPTFVDNDFAFSATWYDPITNNLYVAAGVDGDVYRWDDLTQPNSTMYWKSKTFVTKDFTNVGAARITADYTGVPGSSLWQSVDTNWEATEELWNATDPVTFKLYVDKNLIFTTTQSNDGIFRLPAGYKSDTFEVELQSLIRVRAVYLADTPIGLRTV
jgi:hypothetical protein